MRSACADAVGSGCGIWPPGPGGPALGGVRPAVVRCAGRERGAGAGDAGPMPALPRAHLVEIPARAPELPARLWSGGRGGPAARRRCGSVARTEWTGRVQGGQPRPGL